MCADCCVSCCYSTPPITWGTIGFIIFGMVGFLISCIYGIVEFSSFIDEKGTIVVAPIVAGLIVFTVLPIVMATILAYFVTGYIRDVLFHSCVKSYIGAPCSIFGLKVGLAFSIGLFFALIVAIGLVVMLVIEAANYVAGRENMQYRQANYPRNDEYFMKRVH